MSEPSADRYPAQVLLNLVITLLTPMFLDAADGNIQFARVAAAQTIESYRAETEADLIAIALIIAFGLTALTALSQSMEPGLSLTTTMRLRGNANTCNRAAQQNRTALQQNRQEAPAPLPNPPKPPEPAEPKLDEAPEFDEAEVIASVAATHARARENLNRKPQKVSLREPTEQQYQAAWAAGAAEVAAEIAAEIPNLPPHQRAEATIRAAALRDCANELLSGKTAPRPKPGDLAGLFRPPTA